MSGGPGSRLAGPMPRARQFLERHALALIVALGALIRFATLGVQDLWFDEAVTRDLIRQGPGDLLASVQGGESNPALYYLVAGAWERVFGSSEIAIRSVSALAGTFTIPVLYEAARTLCSRRAGLIAAALTATSPLLVWYSQEARNYELLVLMSALSFLLFVKALDDPGHRWLWGWAVVSALAVGTHYFAIFLIGAEAVWLLLRRPGSRIETALPMGAIVAVGLALLPLAASQRGRGSWIDEYSLSGRLGQVPQHFLAGLEVPWPALPGLAIAIALVAAGYAALRAEPPARRALAIAGSVALGGFAVLLLAALAGSDYILTRNLLELWPPFAVALAVAFASANARRVGFAATAALCAIGLGLAVWIPATPDAQRPDYSELAAALGPADSPRLVVSESSFSLPLVEHLSGLRAATDADLAADRLVVIRPRATEDYAVGLCWWIATCGGRDVAPPPPFEVPAGFRPSGGGSTRFFDYDLYSAPRPVAIARPVEYFTPRVFLQSPE